MLRAFSAFLVLFSILSLIVQQDVLGSLFGMSALSLFAIDQTIAQFAKAPRTSRIRATLR